jgi:hypothetical protein
LQEIFWCNSNGFYDEEIFYRPTYNLFLASFLTLSLHGFSVSTFYDNLFSQARSSKPRFSIDDFMSTYSSWSFSSLWWAVLFRSPFFQYGHITSAFCFLHSLSLVN